MVVQEPFKYKARRVPGKRSGWRGRGRRLWISLPSRGESPCHSYASDASLRDVQTEHQGSQSFSANGSGPRAPGRRNFVTFVTLGPKSILLHATGRQSGTTRRSWAALVQGSSSNLPNGRRHFGQPRTCSQGGTAGERAARLLGSRSPPTPCVPFAEEFQPYTKSKKQYRTMGSHPLHSYLATNRILQLIYDITCI